MEASASLVAQQVKSLPAMQGMRVQSLGQEDPLEKEMVTHSSILPWEITRMEEPGELQSMGVTRIEHNLVTKTPPKLKLSDSFSLCSAILPFIYRKTWVLWLYTFEDSTY